jgi:hypothetical protein
MTLFFGLLKIQSKRGDKICKIRILGKKRPFHARLTNLAASSYAAITIKQSPIAKKQGTALHT